MAVRTVLTYPDPRLEVVAKPVSTVDEDVRDLIADLFDTMYAENGVGLAATQIGDDRRVVVIDCRDGEGGHAPIALVNPEIVERHGDVVWREGCLSVPGVTAEVDRAADVVVTYLDVDGHPRELSAGGLLAVCIQHELDHLVGTLYVDRLGRLERESVLIEYAALGDEKPSDETADDDEGGKTANPLTALRVLFMGTPDFAVPTLEKLYALGCQVVGVVSQPDRPKGRGRHVQHTPVAACARAHGTPLFQWPRLNNESYRTLADLAPDVAVVVAYGKILPARYLALPTHGCLNVHASILPALRGAAPIQWAVINGHAETGVAVMYMDEGMDTGDVALMRKTPIGPDETAGELHDRLCGLGAEALGDALGQLVAGRLPRTVQAHENATYAPRLTKALGRIDWCRTAQEIHNLIRGVSPWPGAFIERPGGPLKIHRSRVATGEGPPGTVLAHDSDGLRIACGSGALTLTRLQRPGKRAVEGADFLRGATDEYAVGKVLTTDE